MMFIKTHFKYNRILLLSIGLWPYERTRLVQLQAALIFGFLISNVIYQLATLVFVKCTPILVINVLSIASYYTIYVILYISFWFNTHTIKLLLDKLEHTCNNLKDENEIAIITKYANIAKRVTIIITLFHVCNISIILLLMFLLYLLEVVLLVDSESNHILQRVLPKFFIGQENYIYLIFFHFIGSASIGGIALIGIGMLVLTFCKHVCGMFKIASYRIEKAMMMNMLENEIIICKTIIHAVDIHRKAVKISMLLTSSFKGSMLFLVGINVISLSLNLYRISDTMSRENDIQQCCIHCLISIVILVFLFITNYVGQEITDYNNDVYFTVYNVRWYVAPLHVQKLMLFLLQNGSKAFRISLNGVFSFSMESFTTLTKASLSYFTVVYSMQQ